MKTKVVNMHHEHYNVYIGRNTKWGNPFIIGQDGNRREVIEKYEEYIRGMIKLFPEKYDLSKIKGKILGCHCKPMPCHGDVLVKICEEAINGK